uniref:Zinc finger PMZ-type domain-containing protein n=1 Tax=Lactuca sativa TaxID=4236 RepID=A0A9R1WEH0_LACSA|nr:hypothetical protein LSAT_V11C200068590 [Lactuca sativa]
MFVLTKKSTSILTKWVEDMVKKIKRGFKDGRYPMLTIQHINGGIVNLREKTSFCKYWQLTSFPYGHVIMVLMHLKNDHGGHMAIDSYKIETYRRMCEKAVYPLSELSDWVVPDDLMVVNHPMMEIRQAGEEPKIRRCSGCDNTTHNVKTCKEIIPKNQSKTKKHTGASGTREPMDAAYRTTMAAAAREPMDTTDRKSMAPTTRQPMDTID